MNKITQREASQATTVPDESAWGDDDYADDDRWCDCGAFHTIAEAYAGQCDCCGKPISCEEYS